MISILSISERYFHLRQYYLKSKTSLVTLRKCNSHLQYYNIFLSFSIKLQEINSNVCNEYTYYMKCRKSVRKFDNTNSTCCFTLLCFSHILRSHLMRKVFALTRFSMQMRSCLKKGEMHADPHETEKRRRGSIAYFPWMWNACKKVSYLIRSVPRTTPKI